VEGKITVLQSNKQKQRGIEYSLRPKHELQGKPR
jgi:hypothetical protein